MSTKKVTKAVAKTALPTQKPVAPAADTVKPVEVHKFYVGTEYGVRYIFKDGEPIREVVYIHVQSDHDMANEPDKAKEMLGAARCELMDRGYYLNDYEANCEAELQVEETLGEWKFMIEYDKKCRKCTVDMLEAMRQMMKLVRDQRELRIDLSRQCEAIPKVIPEDWSVKNGKFIDETQKPPLEVHLKKVSTKELPKPVQDIMSQLKEQIFGNKKAIAAKPAPKKIGDVGCKGTCKRPCKKEPCPAKK